MRLNNVLSPLPHIPELPDLGEFPFIFAGEFCDGDFPFICGGFPLMLLHTAVLLILLLLLHDEFSMLLFMPVLLEGTEVWKFVVISCCGDFPFSW